MSGLDPTFFNNTVAAVNEIYGMFNCAFTQGALGPWNLMERQMALQLKHLIIICMQSRPGLHLESVPFQETVDPLWVLSKLLVSSGAHCVHTEDNEVEYCQGFWELDGKYRCVCHFGFRNHFEVLCRFEVCQPQSIRKGDLVELQLLFVIVALKEDPQKGKQCKLLVVL